MEAVGLAITVTQTVLAVLDCSDLKELFSKFKYKNELEELKKTVLTIQSVLQDADDKGVLNHQEQCFVDNLKNALYDADDLLDEFATVVAQEKQCLLTEAKGLRRVSKKVRRLFSRFEKLSVGYGMCREVKKIRETLDGIASDASKYCFKVDNQPLWQRKETTCSYVYQPGIIGREEETKRVIDMLLDPNVEGHIPVLTIVGMGGLGKTALAQLVFNDSRIEAQFPLKLWVCVNDEGQSQLNVDSVIRGILKSANTDETNSDGLVREQLQTKLRQMLDGKKYLLVLDDVWTEKHTEWLKLIEFMKGDQCGSRIVVTTRSKGTAIAIGSDDNKLTYEMKGLSNDNSWRLFEMTVGQLPANRPDLITIGRAIVKKCANVPLAIKVTGSLLYGQDENKWRSFEANRLAEIGNGDNDIMQILKFSYHHLSPSLKSCFTYCALFPKDFVIDKDMLISLWMAQGYIKPLDKHQNIEDAAAEYFLILLRRCFFQDVKTDEFGVIVSCKIHDLMHDVAQEVARKEICASVANSTTLSSLDETIRHVCNDSGICTKSFLTKAKIRTYLCQCPYYTSPIAGDDAFPVDALIAKLRCLRVLDLSHFWIPSLPNTIGGMVHLRYLDLSANQFLVAVSESITKLHNLQTLLLQGCSSLTELPKDLSKLVNLRVLDITDCWRLTCMPRGMEKLTCLCKLSMFIAAGRNAVLKQGVGEIEDLGPLKNLKGSLEIKIQGSYRDAKKKHGEGVGYLSNKEYLNDICIEWPMYYYREIPEGRVQEQEVLLEDLQPHCNIRVLTIKNYLGERMPRWGGEDKLATSLRNLVKIHLSSCSGLQELPWLSKLHYLKSIFLGGLSDLEYMESNNNISTSSSSSSTGCGEAATEIEMPLFFPSLEVLVLWNLQKLKRWWRVSGDTSSSSRQPVGILPWFPRLSKLRIDNCPNLTSIPLCPTVEDLTLDMFNYNNDTESFSGGELLVEVLCSCSSSLRSLEIMGRIEAFYRHPLKMMRFHELIFAEDEEEEEDGTCIGIGSGSGIPWRSLGHTLRFLMLHSLPTMMKLPKGMHHLTSLQSLKIYACWKLEELPEWIGCFSCLQSLVIDNTKIESLPDAMRNLTSLTKLHLGGCTQALMERCRDQNPQGEDWPKIHHIPNRRIVLH